MSNLKINVADKLLAVFDKHLDNTALWVNGETYSYGNMKYFGLNIAGVIEHQKGSSVGILCGKNLYAYAAILASIFAGKTYIPLSNKESIDYLKNLITRFHFGVLLTDKANLHLAETIASDTCRVIAIENILNLVPFEVNYRGRRTGNDVYMMFTSGKDCWQ